MARSRHATVTTGYGEELIGMTQVTRDDAAVLQTVREVVGEATAGKVFGAPITRDGLTVLPVAKISGGGGGGGNQEEKSHEGGVGGGFGLSAKALGVFVVREGSVRWRPAIDVNKVIMGGQIVAVVALLTLRAFLKTRGRRA
jgi:uncharacterized spore protein YtfJ